MGRSRAHVYDVGTPRCSAWCTARRYWSLALFERTELRRVASWPGNVCGGDSGNHRHSPRPHPASVRFGGELNSAPLLRDPLVLGKGSGCAHRITGNRRRSSAHRIRLYGCRGMVCLWNCKQAVHYGGTRYSSEQPDIHHDASSSRMVLHLSQ